MVKYPKNKTVFFLLIILAMGVSLFLALQFFRPKPNSGLVKYSGKDFSLLYPANFKVSSFPAELIMMISPDYKFNNTRGNIESGYTISVSSEGGKFNFESVDICNKDYERWQTTTEPCLLSGTLTDYVNGKVEKEKVTINGLSAIRYRFTSENGRNHLFGAIIDKGDKQYQVNIAYRTFYDENLFNRILNSFAPK